MNPKGNSFLCGVMLLALSMQAACSPKFMDKTLDQAFAEPKVIMLIEAAEKRDAAGIKRAVKAGADINAQGLMGMTPAHWLLLTNQYDALRLLLEHDADPNVAMKDNWTLTWIVASTRSPELLHMILSKGGNPNMLDESLYETPLMAAIVQFRFDNADLLLDNGADINAHNAANESAATTAIVIGRYDYALKLLRRGYSYNLPDLLKTAEVSHVSDDMEPTRQQVIALVKQKLASSPPPSGAH